MPEHTSERAFRIEMKDTSFLYCYCRRDQRDLLPAALLWAANRGVAVEKQESESGGFTLRVNKEEAEKLWRCGGDIILPFRWNSRNKEPAEGWPLWSRKPTFANNKKEWESSGIIISAAAIMAAQR